MLTVQDSPDYEARRQRLLALLDERSLGSLLVSNLTNICYLTGFRGSAGLALIGPSEARLWVDPRYTLQARQQVSGMAVMESKHSLLKAAGQWMQKQAIRIMGFDDAHLTCAQLLDLENATHRKIRFKRAAGLVEQLRILKDPYEIASIRAASQVTVAVLDEVLHLLCPGVRELDLAAEIEYRMKRRGAEGAAFETIVASGARGAFPHARASSNLLRKDDLVILDLGAILAGYAADMTRTYYLGTPGRTVRRLYSAVVEAQQRAIDAVKIGARAAQVDGAARNVLEVRGLSRYFTHSTGHGVGLEIHERPRLGRNEKTRLEAGFVVTVEPGIYKEGFGGIRVEDTILLGPTGPEILTPAPKDAWILN